MSEFLKQLAQVCKDTGSESDVFGRREATPREILDSISMRVQPDGNNFPNQLEVYYPTDVDIRRKGDDETKKRHMRRISKSGRR